MQKLLLDAKEAQTESAGYQTEPGTLSMTGKKQKKRKDQAFTRARDQAEAVNYRKLDKEVKKSCKQDKKDWIESKCTESQKAASRNDIRSLYGIVRQLTSAKDNTNVAIMTKDGRLLLTESEQNLRLSLIHISEPTRPY